MFTTILEILRNLFTAYKAARAAQAAKDVAKTQPMVDRADAAAADVAAELRRATSTTLPN